MMVGRGDQVAAAPPDPGSAWLRRYVRAWLVAAPLITVPLAFAGSSGPQPGAGVVLAVLVVSLLAANVAMYVPVEGGRRQVSMDEVGNLLAITFLSPPWAIAVTVVTDLAATLRNRDRHWQKVGFNLATRATSIAIASALFRALAGPAFTASPGELLAAVAAAGVFVTVNVLTLSGLFLILSGRRWGEVLRSGRENALMDLGLAGTGIVAATLVVAAPYALPLLALPAVLDRLRLRAQVDHYELTAAKQRAEAANQAKSEFLSRMSHELRTPLNAVLGFAQLLELDERLEPDARSAVELIGRSGRHLLGLIDEVLDISNIEAGRLAMHLEDVRAGAVVAEAVDLVRPLATDRQVEVRVDDDGADLHVCADHQRLRQVLLNLLSNAVKYDHAGGRTTVTVAARDPAVVRIAVQDTGPGIEPADRAKLFVAFERLDAPARGIEGTGLGLALSKHLVELMDGTIVVSSTPGEGSTFTVEVPRAPAPSPADAPGPAPAAPAVTEPTGTRARIVYIEDNPQNVELVRRVLRRRDGIELTTAPDATIGLAQVRELRPHLVLLDLELPGMDGATALRHLQADARLSSIPVAVLSADASPRRIDELRAAGAVEYLTKPLDVHELLALVDRWAGAAPSAHQG
jgi:signal transduction histidine kinase/CheY-like chemotaxis protein